MCLVVDRISKRVILAWAVAALFAQSYLVSSAWPGASTVVTVLFLGGVATTLIDRRLLAVALAPAYLAPILLVFSIGRYHSTLTSPVVLAPLLGAMTPDAIRSGWRLPAQWRAPLVCWLGVVCVTVPIVVARTADFHLELLSRGRSPFEALGGFPLVTAAWVVHSGLLLVVGALWFDWLRARDRSYVERWVVMPLAAGAVVLVLVLLWQMFVDIGFLNATVYARLKRASGTLMDANAAGVVAAWWVGAAFFAARESRGMRRGLALAAVPVVWVAVWATGSRTAFGLAAFSSVVGVLSVMERSAAGRGLITKRTLKGLAALVAIAALGAALIAQMPSGASGPVARLRAMLPTRDLAGLRAVTSELWNRNGYGTVASQIIDAYPAFGIGIGTFHEIASEYAPKLPPDNAQNWFRHQIAETGAVGSLGWIVLFATAGWWLLRRPASDDTRRARPLFGALAGFTLISLLGMPGQDLVVALTLWTFAAWYLHVSGWPVDASPAGAAAPRRAVPGRLAWTLALVIIAISGAGTYVAAMGRLRTPARIQRMGGDFMYGFSWPEADGQGGEFRWARSRATAIVPTSSRSLELTLQTNRPDLSDRPLLVRAWVDGRRVIDGSLTTGANTLMQTVTIPAGEARALIDIWTDRSITAPPPDGRELAVMVRWRFVAPSALTSPPR